MNTRIQITLFYLFYTFFLGYSQQQPTFFQTDSIKNNSAYALCLIQPTIKDTILHLKKDCKIVYDIIPATYDTSFIEVVVKPPSSSVYPIEYDTTGEFITTRINKNIYPAIYDLVTEQVLLIPPYKKWILDKPNNKWALVSFPPKYHTINKMVIKSGHSYPLEEPPNYVRKLIPLETIPKHLIDIPAEKIIIEQITITPHRIYNQKMHCTQIDTVNHQKVEIPKDYLAYKEVLPKSEWKLHLKKIKARLKVLGYLEKAKNRKMNKSLKEALIQYQQDNNLAIGQLTLETIEHLKL